MTARPNKAVGAFSVLAVALAAVGAATSAGAAPLEEEPTTTLTDDKFVGMHYSTWFGDDYPWFRAWDPDSFSWTFETDDFDLEWFSDGTAFGSAPTETSHGSLSGWGNDRWADSIVNGETATGILTSGEFTIDGSSLTFKRAGYDGPSGGLGQNRYELRRASDNQLLLSAAPPQSDSFSTVTWDVTSYFGQSVYFQAVDSRADSGWAWLALDDLQVGTHTFDFESEVYTRWRDRGSAFGDAPESAVHGGIAGYQGHAWADSYRGGESATGSLRSRRFTVDGGELRFLAAGWDGTGGGTANGYSLRRASDDVVLFSAPAPLSDVFVPVTWDLTGLAGVDVYFEIVDGNSSSSYAWVAADEIIWDKNPVTVEPLEGFYNSADVTVAENHAETLGGMGVDFLMFDGSNNTIWGPDHPQQQYRDDALYDSAVAVAETFATVPDAPKATMMFSVTTWDSDETRIQRDITRNYDSGTPYMYYPWIPSNSGDLFADKMGRLYTDLASDPDKYFYYEGKPLLFLYVSAGATVYDQNGVDQTPDGTMPATWNPTVPGTGGQGIRDVFNIRWVSALMSGSGNPKLVDVAGDPLEAHNGHWSFIDKTPQTWAARQTSSGEIVESVVVSPNGDGQEPRNNGATYEAQWERALDLDPVFVTISQWNSFSTSGDERSPEYSSSIEPTTNYFGSYYKELTEDYIAEFKGLTP